MTRDQPDQRPTDAELGILRVLWRLGPSTVREVTVALNAERDIGYTTALKLMQIMAEKGLVTRDERQRSHVYTARFGQGATQDLLVDDLARRAFDGSPARLALHALSERPASKEELDEIRRLLDELEARR